MYFVIKKAINAKNIRIIKGKGIPKTSPCPMKKNLSGNPIIGHPFVITKASPRAAVKVPRVIIKGGTLSFATKRLCQRPTREEIKSTINIEIVILSPFFIDSATSTPVKATNEPTDKSIPLPMITKVSPIANRPKIATCLAIICRLKELINLGLIMVIPKLKTIRAKSMFSSRK